MLNEEFLNSLMAKEDVSLENKIKSILSEKEADERGLIQKRDNLLGEQKKLKDQLKQFTDEKSEYETKITGLEEELKKASSEEHKQYYEAQLANLQTKHAEEIESLTKDRDFFKGEHYKSLRDKAIEDGLNQYTFVEGLKKGFVSRVLEENDFQPQEIDGQIKFLNKENHTIEEAIQAFALTPEGKFYVKNPSNGGGASGGSGTGANVTKVTRTQFDSMTPQQQMDFSLKGGTIV